MALGAEVSSPNYFTLTLRATPVPTHVNDTPRGNRIPTRPIECVIDPEGIHITNVDESDINLYEVCDLNGDGIAAFTDSLDFITFIFTNQGKEIEIRIHTDDQILCGFLYL